MIWRFQIYNLFREKFTFRGFTKTFKNFAKYIIAFIFTKFKYFAKQIIYLESSDHQLQNDIWYVCVLRVWNFFIWASLKQLIISVIVTIHQNSHVLNWSQIVTSIDLLKYCYNLATVFRAQAVKKLDHHLIYSLLPGFWQSFISIEVCRDCIPALTSSCKNN